MINGNHAVSVPHSLGERLRQKRKEMGWTQEQLASRAGTTQAVIQKIENGKSLRPRKIDKIAEPLGVLPAWLMFGDERYDQVEAEAMEIVEAWRRLDPDSRAVFKRQIIGQAHCIL
ncbi:MAG: transcriptional regulator with XRE-family HTH domain [Gammaproteobacteria bacterium]|jgi:transcriptional regulator with XRE-family HTH domain